MVWKEIENAQTIQMVCPALGVWVAFLKQPDALPGRAPPKKYILNIFFIFFCFECFKKAT
jgi:hypothetical protein